MILQRVEWVFATFHHPLHQNLWAGVMPRYAGKTIAVSSSIVYPSNKFLCLRTNVVLTVPHTQSPFHHHVCGWFPHDPQDSPLPAVGYHLSWGMGIMPPLGLTWHMVMRKDLYIYIPLVKGSLARKLPSYGRLSWSALASPSSCQPHHHVNQPSSSSWEVQQFGYVWVHGWKQSRARNPVFFFG